MGPVHQLNTHSAHGGSASIAISLSAGLNQVRGSLAQAWAGPGGAYASAGGNGAYAAAGSGPLGGFAQACAGPNLSAMACNFGANPAFAGGQHCHHHGGGLHRMMRMLRKLMCKMPGGAPTVPSQPLAPMSIQQPRPTPYQPLPGQPLVGFIGSSGVSSPTGPADVGGNIGPQPGNANGNGMGDSGAHHGAGAPSSY